MESEITLRHRRDTLKYLGWIAVVQMKTNGIANVALKRLESRNDV